MVLIQTCEITVARKLISISPGRTRSSPSTLSAVSTTTARSLRSPLSNAEASTLRRRPFLGTACWSWRPAFIRTIRNRCSTPSSLFLLPSLVTATRTAWRSNPVTIRDANWPSVTACCANCDPASDAGPIRLPLLSITQLERTATHALPVRWIIIIIFFYFKQKDFDQTEWF